HPRGAGRPRWWRQWLAALSRAAGAQTVERQAASLGAEAGEEVVEVLLLLMLGGLELLDVGLVLLDLRLLLIELLQIPLVRLGRTRHLLEVGAQPGLILHNRVQLPLLLADLPLRLLQQIGRAHV